MRDPAEEVAPLCHMKTEEDPVSQMLHFLVI
jgi:hypothetical protein